jgi:hypothetical protein
MIRFSPDERWDPLEDPLLRCSTGLTESLCSVGRYFSSYFPFTVFSSSPLLGPYIVPYPPSTSRVNYAFYLVFLLPKRTLLAFRPTLTLSPYLPSFPFFPLSARPSLSFLLYSGAHCPSRCFLMLKRKKTAADIFNEAEENGWEPIANADVNSDPVSKPIEPGTELNYDRTVVLWDE